MKRARLQQAGLDWALAFCESPVSRFGKGAFGSCAVRRASELCPYLSILGDLAFFKDLDALFCERLLFGAHPPDPGLLNVGIVEVLSHAVR